MHPDLNSAEEDLQRHGVAWQPITSNTACGGLILALPVANASVVPGPNSVAARRHNRCYEISHSGHARRPVQRFRMLHCSNKGGADEI